MTNRWPKVPFLAYFWSFLGVKNDPKNDHWLAKIAVFWPFWVCGVLKITPKMTNARPEVPFLVYFGY